MLNDIVIASLAGLPQRGGAATSAVPVSSGGMPHTQVAFPHTAALQVIHCNSPNALKYQWAHTHRQQQLQCKEENFQLLLKEREAYFK